MHLYRKLISTKVDDGNENNLGSRIEQLLKELDYVISQMQALVSSGGSEIFSHTLTRHQEIHHDLSQVITLLYYLVALFAHKRILIHSLLSIYCVLFKAFLSRM